MLGKSLIKAAAGNVGGEVIEDLFQTWLYTGNGSTQTITNGIDLAGEGGLVWAKCRNIPQSHGLFDTIRGGTGRLFSNTTAADDGTGNLSFSSSGFSLTNGNGVTNSAGDTYASWTFRKAPGFFDVVTYTGNGVQGRAINHNLGRVPGCIIVKCTSAAYGWTVYHRSTGKDAYLILSSTVASTTDNLRWDSTDPTSSQFTVGNAASVNESGQTYVAYLFAHDEQIFGESGDQSMIKCGSQFVDNVQTFTDVFLGWEPQWVLSKTSSAALDWNIHDNMRGVVAGGNDAWLRPNSSGAENTLNDFIEFTPTGFRLKNTLYGGNQTVIYIAIRRGPMKTPTSGTEVFLPSATARNTEYTVGFPPDMAISKTRLTTDPNWVGDRLRGNYPTLKTESAAAEQTGFLSWTFDATTGRWKDILSNDPIQYLFRRAPGFFDVVAYTGTGAARTVAHNLGVAPELIIVKARTIARSWVTDYVPGNLEGFLDGSGAFYSGIIWNNGVTSTGISTTFSSDFINGSGATYIAYLFATLPGISKVFSFTGNGTSQTIDCGFAAGARFVLLKRTDSAGNWLVADTARGIISGNDPLLYINSTAAEITTLDWIDPHSSGFIVNQEATANANVGGATYIGLAIA